MTKVIVTGGSGKLGRAVLKDLVANGYEVLNLDQFLPKDPIVPTVRIDLRDFGEVAGAILGGVDEQSAGRSTRWCTLRRSRRRGCSRMRAPSPTTCR